MKKLLLGAMLAAACVSDADASAFQTKSSKNNVDTILKADMGNYYKGMVYLINSMLVGWANSLSYAVKDPDFSKEKTQLSTAEKKLKIIADFTKSMLNRDRESGITKNQSKAVTAAQALNDVINGLKTTEYWKHCGAQLRFSVITIANSLQSLAQKNELFAVSGARVSSSQGWIDGNGYSVNYNLADDNDLIRNDSMSGTSKISGLLSEFKKINRNLAITQVQSTVTPVPTSVSNPFAQVNSMISNTLQNAAAQAKSMAVAPVQNTAAQVTIPAVAPVQNTAAQVTIPAVAPVQNTAAQVAIPAVAPVQNTVAQVATPAATPVQNTAPVQPTTKKPATRARR